MLMVWKSLTEGMHNALKNILKICILYSSKVTGMGNVGARQTGKQTDIKLYAPPTPNCLNLMNKKLSKPKHLSMDTDR